mmetsp:Transcript_6792/g.15691  ORF Transcript_6792/g.15691 Transcript_6792/m.15691 type:complete len:104 (-) Transcript_6792:29-340(-)|eukprot:CAMPEP_0114545178 /NCGR_PEP_ID=MMETSP0114-20121206/3262_1 /TAXON_ID=31324 /ORGANISM="Goniomonas sp, Strain m" /LENGTH=103 /DNA_ID=CAMNT_0001729589 /DNA_START=24 /DNA_END=335 /DNA_ORIENTATION=-
MEVELDVVKLDLKDEQSVSTELMAKLTNDVVGAAVRASAKLLATERSAQGKVIQELDSEVCALVAAVFPGPGPIFVPEDSIQRAHELADTVVNAAVRASTSKE